MSRWLFALLLLLIPSRAYALSAVQDTEQKQLSCLASNIYHEGRSLEREDQVSIGYVTINRTKNRKFPSTVCRVVFQKGQFLWTSRESKKIKEIDSWNTAVSIARDVFYNRIPDPTHGSLYFYEANLRVRPIWSRSKVVMLKRHHIYLRDRA